MMSKSERPLKEEKLWGKATHMWRYDFAPSNTLLKYRGTGLGDEGANNHKVRGFYPRS